MKKHSVACDICKRTFEHDKLMVAKQMLGTHKAREHGIPGRAADPEQKRMYSREGYWRKRGYTEEQIIQKRAAYAAKLAAEGSTAPPPQYIKKPVRKEPERLALPECPCCGARFYVTRKDSDEDQN